uniref:RING-type domain-containing protein n=1 Tax=Tetraselmis sp. GSL018 TaxID=582737 RepID=A0A061RUP8_9CHLO|mmetsp:Transcript_6534/g.15695  ORF Transcript_6534/g.15695 Transcript_6534/m.15695 type:complete len:498 (-) Transcript_6534:96-1589(-)
MLSKVLVANALARSLVLIALLCRGDAVKDFIGRASEVAVDPLPETNTSGWHLDEFPGEKMPLLDCAFANGSPHGLSCEKEGKVIVGFERRGQWIAGGGAVPLSRALCCRLGFPGNVTSESLPDVPLTPAKPVAVVSFGCHPSTATGGKQVMCEEGGKSQSMLSGFGTAIGVGLRLDTYYPLGAAQCCTPAVLLENGDLWSYRRCNCVPVSGSVNCPRDKGFASMGFAGWRVTRSGNFVPVAPAMCCQVCLGDKIKPTDECSDLNDCSGRGRCSFGRCECMSGWAGPDCSRAAGGRGGGILDSWQLAVVIIGATGMLASLLILCSHLYRLQQREEMEGHEDDYMESLLLDDQGSVGSVDTSDEEREEDEEAEGECGSGRVGGPPPRREAGAQAGGAPGTSDDGHADADGPPPESGPSSQAEAGEGASEEAGSEAAAPLLENFAMADSGECLVCMLKPIQAVLVPCGHAVVCRRCARRLSRCPMCRKDIARRQRLFLGK